MPRNLRADHGSCRAPIGRGIGLTLSAALAGSAWAAPTTPTYSVTANDSITGLNQFSGTDGKERWTVTPGADSYQNEFYERPTAQTYNTDGGDFSATEYFEFLDITQARFGYDSQFMFVSIELNGRDKITDDGTSSFIGLKSEYGSRFALDADGRNGYLVRVTDPENEHGTTWGKTKNFGFKDTDGDVGGANPSGPSGLSVTKDDEPAEESGPPALGGYDTEVISDGKKKDNPNKDDDLLYARIDPTNNNRVEIALDYTVLGLTQTDIENILYLDAQAIEGDPTDPQNYFWNDKYNKLEAGSPYNLAEFGSDGTSGGLGNIYELDTVRLIPEPTSAALLALGGLALLARRRG